MSKTSTKYTYLMEGTGTYPNLAWSKLADIVDFSDLHGDPNMLDTTDLSCGAQTQTDGVRTAAPQKFRAHWQGKAWYEALEAKAGTEMYIAVWFGSDLSGNPDGHDAKFVGKGKLSLKVLGKGVDEVRDIELSFAMSMPFDKVTPSAPVAISSAVQQGGESGVTASTGIKLTFDVSVTGLKAEHITLSNGTGSATKGALTGSGKNWTLAISNVVQGNVGVLVSNVPDFAFPTTVTTVEVYAPA